MTEQPPVPAWVRLVTLVGAGSFLLFGLWAFAAPQAFFDALAVFPPFNAHFVRDIGAFQVGLGAVLGLASFPDRFDGLAAALLGVGTGGLLHAVGHVLDSGLGGNPVVDIPSLGLLAVALLAAGVVRLRQ